MKKFAVLTCICFSAINAFAYYGDDYGYSSHSNEMSSFAIFTLIVMIAYIIISFIVLTRWWKMTTAINEIKEHLDHSSPHPKLTYLVATGDIEAANKRALVMLVDELMSIYYDKTTLDKANCMNSYITSLLPKIEKLGLILPEYVKTGEAFINYINSLTGNNVQYSN